jgi:peptidoglycan/xylan/chitin deacetylase (PgdA/CDA1 family)
MRKTQVPILTYHALEESPSIIALSPAVFAWQLRWLHQNGYQVIPLSRLVQHVCNGDPLPSRSIVITFDDGFATSYTHAFPVLMRYGFPATIFLVAGYCGRQNDWPDQPLAVPRLSLLTWAQIREMDRHGIEFGAHSITHPWLDRLAPDELEYEILVSKASIEEQVGHTIECFAYPYGRHNEAIKAIVGRAYAGACTTRLGMVGIGSDPLALERIEALYVARSLIFRQLLNPLFSSYVNLRRPLRALSSFILSRPWQ